MVESTAVSCIQSSPDKNNNSVDRIISKEEEREDPRRDSSIYLRVQWCFHKYKFLRIQYIPTRTTVFLHAIQQSSHPVQRNYSTYRINSSTRNTTTTRLIPCHPVHTRHLPATVPRVSKHSTRQTPAIRLPTAFQGHTVQAGFQ